MRRRLVALVAAVGFTASAAEAQQWYQLCTGSGGASCAAVNVNLSAASATTTLLSIRAQNLQGSVAGTTGPSVLEQLYFHFATPLSSGSGYSSALQAGPGVTSYAGTGNLAGMTAAPWSYMTDAFTVALFADNPDAGHFTDIRGCGGPSPLEDPGFITCGSRGTRWVGMSVLLDGTFADTDLQSVGFATSYGDFGLDQHVCNEVPGGTNNACRVERFAVSAVPEPSTFVLMFSGLASVAVFARRRRRDAK